MLVSNYPPLYLALVAWLSPSEQSLILVARLVSLLGFLLAALMVGLSAYAATSSRMAGIMAFLVLMISVRVSASAPTCSPDHLALGLGCAAVTVAAYRLRGWPLLSGLLLGLSLLAKHSLISFPLGLGLWALRNEPRRLPILIATSAITLFGVLLPLHALAPLINGSVSPWLLPTFTEHMWQWVLPSIVGIGIAAWTLRLWTWLPDVAQRVLGPWAGVFVCGLLWLPAVGRDGSGCNYLEELLASMAVLCSVVLWLKRARWLSDGLVAVSLAETVGWIVVLGTKTIPQGARRVRAAQQALSGPAQQSILAEPTWYAAAAGRLPVIIPFYSIQLSRRGLWSPTPLIQALRTGRISRVLLYFPLNAPRYAGYFHPGVNEALRDCYKLVGNPAGIYIYEPMCHP